MNHIKQIIQGILCSIKILYNKVFGYENGLIILMYHSITDITDNQDKIGRTVPKILFDIQMNYLNKCGYNIISLKKGIEYILCKSSLPKKSIIITFDDGYEDNYLNAWPILKKYNYPATIFLISSYVDRPRNFDYLLEKGIHARSLDYNQIQEMQIDSDLITFGFHTKSHVRLSRQDASALDDELSVGLSNLEKRGIKTDLFAYPYGVASTFNEIVIQKLKALRILAACTTITGINKPGDDVFRLKRIHIGWYDDIRDFRNKLIGCDKWIKKIANIKERLV